MTSPHDAEQTEVGEPGAITQLMRTARAGDQGAEERLSQAIYRLLHRMARQQMAGQPADHTLQATALVHEAWLKIGAEDITRQDRTHFIAVAARAMRQVLIDHARTKGRAKRSGKARVLLDHMVVAYETSVGGLTELDAALARMRLFEPEMTRAVELRFFGGATVDECAAALGMSKRTFERRWTATKAWLKAELSG